MKKTTPARPRTRRKPVRSATKKTGHKVARAHSGRRYELFGLALFAAGLISICGICGLNVGFVGVYFAKFLRYFFGVGSILIAVLILLIAWTYMTRHRGPKYSPRFFGILALFISVLAIWHHFKVPVGAEIMPESLPTGGGLLGGGFLLLLRKFFGVDGSIIILGVGTVGAVLLSTTWSLAAGLLKTQAKAKKGAVAAGSALSSTYGKMAEVGGRVEEHVATAVREKVEKVHGSFYNQDKDERFRESPENSPVEQNTSATAKAAENTFPVTGLGENPAENPVKEESAEPHADTKPDFTIEFGRNHENESPAAEAGERPMGLPDSVEPIGMTPPPASLQNISRAAGTDGLRKEAPADSWGEESLGMPADSAPAAAKPAFTVPKTAPVVPPSPSPMKKHPTEMPSYGEIAPIMPAAAILDGSAKTARGGLGESQKEEVKAPAAPPRPYILPQVTEILTKHVKKHNAALEMEIADKAHILQQTLEDFHVKAKIINACHGPAVTRYELEPAPGVKVSKITNLADDLALSLAATSVRIEPIPGKAAIGIEVPNKELEGVALREVLENERFAQAKSKLTVGLGMDIGGQAIFADLAKMPHLLVAGATGSGKSVCINTLITSILFKAKPDEVKFILVDPKMVELSNYNGIPHLMVPVVTEAKKAASVLNWSVQEMEKRYAKFAEHNVRNMETYNNKFPDDKMPAIVIIIDELADLMMVAPHDVEDAICRLAQKARAAGIHMVLATQRPSVDVITGIIKANIPSRISFAVSSQIDSRTILDRSGAEKLLGRGDMLFYPVGAAKPMRVQGAFISDEEVEKLLDFIRAQGQEMEANEEIISFTENAMKEEEAKEEGKGGRQPKLDELLPDAVNLVMSTGQASASSIQRRFRVGYTRAARLIDEMEDLKIVGPNIGSKPREILMGSEQALAAVEAAMAES
ncbi:MAG: DNA translocase FtsK 4TM domain-containing protein [Mitsuokella sp.]|uniref:FtsK/SpoIIIE family DNA translocase n=1 Tax=Mitsuokella sp. TaxID=2049034 RepID=UPI003F06E5AE